MELTPRSYRATKKPTRWNQHRLYYQDTKGTLFIVELTPRSYRATKKPTRWNQHRRNIIHSGINTKILQGHKETDCGINTDGTLFKVELTPRSYRATKKPTRWNQHRLYYQDTEGTIFTVELTPRSYRAAKKQTLWD